MVVGGALVGLADDVDKESTKACASLGLRSFVRLAFAAAMIALLAAMSTSVASLIGPCTVGTPS